MHTYAQHTHTHVYACIDAARKNLGFGYRGFPLILGILLGFHNRGGLISRGLKLETP